MKTNNAIYINRTKLKNKPINQKNISYKSIFHCPINLNDCINSIDLFEDKVVFGTLMGDVFLCRVDENKLNGTTYPKAPAKKESKNSLLSLNKTQSIENDESNIKLNNNNANNKCDCIKLSIENNNENDDNYDDNNYNNNVKIFNKKKKKKNSNLRNNVNNNNNENRNYTYEKNMDDDDDEEEDENKYEKKLVNKNMGKTQSHQNDGVKDKIDELDTKLFNEKKEQNSNRSSNKNLKFPQITKLINRAKENIPCLEFENNDVISISVGDLEVLRLENMSTFNINDKNSTYNYSKLRNYKTENEHIEFCETCTCMICNSCFLIVFSQYGNFNSTLEVKDIKYENKNLKEYEIIKGSIKMSNYAVPFDFDGDQFLFLDYISKDERTINVIYTASKKENYSYFIKDKKFGHISHMKLLPDNKIFLCRNNVECEIHIMNNEFELIEKWSHFGEDVISSFVLKNKIISNLIDEETDENTQEIDKKESKINIYKFFRNNMDNNNNGLNSKRVLLNSNKTINIKPFNEDVLSINKKTNNKQEKNLISSNEKNYIHTDNNYNITFKKKNLIINNYMPSLNPSFDNSSRREINFTPENKRFTSNINSKSSNDSKNLHLYTSGNKKKTLIKNSISSIEIYGKKNQNPNKNGIERPTLQNGSNFENDEDLTIINNKENKINYSIITLDKDGKVNVFHNKKQKTLFNIYNIKNIDDKYKKMEFFSVGFPYYIVVNELYFCITTDHGLFVISRDLD